MTSLGKLLVYLNTFVAVVLFGWAVSLYTNRVEWFDRTTDDGVKIDGQLNVLNAEVKRMSEQIKASQVAYAAASDRANRTELERDFRALTLAARMDAVKRVDDKVRFLEQLRELKSALIDVRRDGPVVTGLNGQPLQGLATLRKRFDDLSAATNQRQAAILKYRAEYKAISEEILVVQAEVLRQKLIFNNLKDEQEYLSDARINWEEQLRILEIRKAQLQARIDALGASPKVGITESK